MSEHMNTEEEDLLQSALSTAFSPASLPRQSAEPEPALATSAEASASEPSAPALPEAPVNAGDAAQTEEVWKAEYEAQLAEWRRQSAEQRQKAEATRAQWEAIREQERREGKSRQSVLSESTSGWENLSGTSVAAASPSPADARDLVSGEGQGGHSKEYLESVLPGAPTSTSTPASQPASEPESKQDKWDSMTSSLTSSFPSMSFPSDPHSPISSTAPRDLPHHHGQPHSHAAGHSHGHTHSHHHRQHDEPQRTASLSVFDSSLSPKTRTLALLSSLAINVLLPFVNGVMLGFGEIFAKNVVGWLGWKAPGTASASTSRGPGRVASGVGLGKK
ncbi:hypothetical protein K466DRAFT_585942 [Polyporus arcularius HHB13444]|uniref:TOM13-domain-containing protein n=1 Tax=Polyporus arcularius HHB13444 TaxID=1314778 RepID=A0A5C3PPN8_9APHY|nr:hypothetical protein K466DRAFT_585942 [Polyporus arcularius HHB13444]